MIANRIVDGTGTKQAAKVRNESLYVTLRGSPPLGDQKVKIFRQYFTDDGTSDGSSDMSVDASTTDVDFYIRSKQSVDTYITAVNIVVGYAATAGLYEWADTTALTNGHRFFYARAEDEIDIHDSIKTNADIIRLSVSDLLNTSWQIRNLGGVNDYGYVCTINFLSMMPPYGLGLSAGSAEQIIFRIRDDNTDATTMNAIGYGFQRFE